MMAPVIPWSSGVKVLGVPMGPAEFIGGETTKTLVKLDACFQRLRMLSCAFSAFHILRSCLSACKVMFLLRTLPFEAAEALANEAQSRVALAFNQLLGVALDPPQWALACLPVKRGGLGILDPKSVAAAAHVASFLVSSVGAHYYELPQCKTPFSFFRALTLLEPSSPGPASALRLLIHPGAPVAADLTQRELFEAWTDQHQWTDSMHDFQSVLLDETLPRRVRVMRELSSASHAGSWLTCPSVRCPATKWASNEWQALLLWRLGAPLGLPVVCSACGACQDSYGDHALSCSAMGLYKRHNTVRDTVSSLAASAGIQCRTEVALPGTDLVPADALFPSLSDFPLAADFSVVHPLHPSASAQAAVTAGAAAEARAADKVASYGEKCKERAWDYWAIVAETTGAWSQAGQRFFRRLARARALRSGEPLSEALSAVWMEASRAVARGVARQRVRARQQLQ